MRLMGLELSATYLEGRYGAVNSGRPSKGLQVFRMGTVLSFAREANQALGPDLLPARISKFAGSEAEPGSKLHVARRQVAVGGAKVGAGIAEGGIHSVEIDPVEEVERIQTNLEVQTLGDRGFLLHREIRIRIAGVA